MTVHRLCTISPFFISLLIENQRHTRFALPPHWWIGEQYEGRVIVRRLTVCTNAEEVLDAAFVSPL